MRIDFSPASAGLSIYPAQIGLHILPFFAYAGIVPSAKICTVMFTDADRITHGVKVSASTLNEACVLAIAAFRRSEWKCGAHATLTVIVREPEMKHELPVAKITAWLASSGKSPSEQAMKSRLRDLLTA